MRSEGDPLHRQRQSVRLVLGSCLAARDVDDRDGIILIDSDPETWDRLRCLGAEDKIVNDPAACNRLYDLHHDAILDALARISEGLPRRAWWSGHIAARSSQATTMIQDVVNLILLREAVERSEGSLCVICSHLSLLQTAAKWLTEVGCRWEARVPWGARVREIAYRFLRPVAMVTLFLYQALRVHRDRRFRPDWDALRCAGPVWLVRSFVSAVCFRDGHYRDRHFGDLLPFLKERGVGLVHVPLRFDSTEHLGTLYARMAEQQEWVLLPEAAVPLKMWLDVLGQAWLRACAPIGRVDIAGVDMGPLLLALNRRHAWDYMLLQYTLLYPLLEVCRARGVMIAGFLYPFENNAPDKHNVLGRDRSYPEAICIGYNHSVWLSRQPGAEVTVRELSAGSHPLPDWIVSCGPEPTRILGRSGFPHERIKTGPSLRFESVRTMPWTEVSGKVEERGVQLFLPLPYSQRLSTQLFARLGEALDYRDGYRVAVKMHPLLPVESVERRARDAGLPGLEFWEEEVRACLGKADVCLTIGTSVSQLESLAAGVPLVRVVPAGELNADPMFWMDYPLTPASTGDELAQRLTQATSMTERDRRHFRHLARECFFGAVDNKGFEVFADLIQNHSA